MIRAYQGIGNRWIKNLCKEGRDPRVPSSIKQTAVSWGTMPVHCVSKEGFFFCLTLAMEGAAESRSITSSSQNKVMDAGFTWDLVKSQTPVSVLETDPWAPVRPDICCIR